MGLGKDKKRIMLIGGTKRAVNTLSNLLRRTDVEFVHAVFMKGHPDEHVYAEELSKIAEKSRLSYEVTDRVTHQTMEIAREKQCDAFIGIGVWRSIFPEEFLTLSRYGFLALHGTPLPRYRGFAGIYWQIINGDESVVIRGLQLASGIDDGPIILDAQGNAIEGSVSLDNELHLSEILEEYETQHIKLLNKIVDLISSDSIQFKVQDNSGATYACHRGPEDGEVNWQDSTRNIFNFIRAQSKPLIGAYTYYQGGKVYLQRVKPRYDYSNFEGRICGKVVYRDVKSGSVIILTQDSAIEVIEAEIKKAQDLIPLPPKEIFTSIRMRCTSEVEAFIFNLRIERESRYDVL